jgi:hypothetical protein
MRYVVGDRPRFTASFKRSDGTLMDPTGVVAKTRDPAGVETTFVYGTDSDLVRSSVGVYYIDVDLTTHGTWTIRCVGTGNLAGAEEISIIARRSEFANP